MNFTKQQLTDSSVVLWILDNQFVTEKNHPVEFVQHRWAIDYLNDDHHHKVAPKAAQAGMTFLEFLDDIHLVGKKGLEVAHSFHTDAILQKIVRPKLNPLIANNPAIKEMLTTDSEGLKGFNNSFLHIIGANSEGNAISFSADVLKIDEKDRSNLSVVEMLESRLKASNVRYIREFSNPSAIGTGVDASWRRSNQFHWVVKCEACGHRAYIDWERNDAIGMRTHYVEREKRIFACGKCDHELSNAERIRGEWVARFPTRDEVHGYWISQLMCPWISAADIVADYDTKSIEYFYNFVLGKAYTPSDLVVNREAILRACVPSIIPRVQVALGVDQKASEMEWVAGTARGVFAYGRAKSWEEIEHLKLMWNATVVADAMPYTTGPKQLAEKYSDVFMCYFKDTKGLDVIEWKGSVVYADRTRLLDIVAKEIVEAKLLFRMRPNELEEYIADWQNIYRTTIEEPDGRVKSQWLKMENKESDFSFATAYMRIALSRILGGSEMSMIEPTAESTAPVTDEVREDGLYTTVNEAVKETLAEM
jgi:hypothetical protein